MKGKEYLDGEELDIEDAEWVESISFKLSKMKNGSNKNLNNNKWAIKSKRKQTETNKNDAFRIKRDQ